VEKLLHPNRSRRGGTAATHSTGELNRWLADVDLERGTSPASRHVKIYYITQAMISPPTWCSAPTRPSRVHFSYQRFLENRLRAGLTSLNASAVHQRLKKRDSRADVDHLEPKRDYRQARPPEGLQAKIQRPPTKTKR